MTINSVIPRSIQFAILNDEYGVSEETWQELREYLDEDIYQAVKVTDGRYYLHQELRSR